jgi:hypothetical protein
MGVSSMVDQEVCGLHPIGFDPYHTSPFMDDFLGFASQDTAYFRSSNKRQGQGRITLHYSADSI